MKVSLESVEMSDEQRVQLADVLDGKVSKRKATRIEAKEFIWQHGARWAVDLKALVNGEEQVVDSASDAEDDEDLIGSDELDDLL